MKSIIQTTVLYSVWDSVEPISNDLSRHSMSVIHTYDARTYITESIITPVRDSVRLSVNNAIYDDVCDIIKEMNRND
jgi:hypothetical protein